MAQIPVNITNEQETSAPPNLYTKNAYGPENFGAGLAKGLDRWADLEFKLQQERNADKDQTDVLAAYGEASKQKSYLLYDPDNGLYSRQGANVNGVVDDFEKGNKTIGESASKHLSPEAKKKFDAMWLRSEGADREGVMKHEMAQRQKYRVDTGNAVIDLAINNATLDYANPDVISRSKSEIMGAVMSAHTGADKKTIAEEVMKGYSSMHKGIISKLMVDSPSRAEQYFKSNVGELTAADNVAVSNMLRGQIFRSNVLKDAERITRTSSGPVRKLYDTLSEADPKTGALMKALTQQESGFRPGVRAYNDGNPEKTAVGLTQVLVGTAREISAELGDGLITPSMKPGEIEKVLENPKINLRYGMHYLDKALKEFGGDLEASLIAYNAGPGNARKWLRAGRDYAVLPDRKQTEPYTRNVMAMYRRNLGGVPYQRTAQNMDAAGVRPSATDAQLEGFRTHFDAEAIGAELNAGVEDGAAQLFDVMPEIVKEAVQMTSAGGDLQMSVTDPFAREWIMMNADTFGINATELEGQITLSTGRGPTDMGVMVDPQEYDLNEWLNEASQIEDPARRAAVTKELMARHAALQKAHKQDENSLKQEAWSLALDGKEIPIELQKQLQPSYLSSINEYVGKVNAEGKVRTDWALWANLRTKTDEELQSLGDVMQYRPKLADPEFKTLVDMVREARGHGDPSKKGLTGAVRTRTQIVADTVATHFKKDAEREGKLNAALDSEVTAYFDTYGKQPSAVEIQGMVDRLIMSGNVRSSWRDQFLFEIAPGEIIEEPMVADEAAIPEGYRAAALANAPQLFGRPLTTDEKRWAFTAAVAWKRGAYVQTPSALRQKLIEMGVAPDNVDRAFGKTAALIFGVK